MKTNCLVSLGAATLAAVILSTPAGAAVAPIDSVDAGVDGSPPYELQSITVGGYTVTRSMLAVGEVEALPGGTDSNNDFFGTWPPPYDPPAPAATFDINAILARNNNPNPIIVRNFGGGLWTDVNGANPDFFIFEAVSGTFGDQNVEVQAILPGDVLGQAISLGNTADWGATGLRRVGNPNNGQAIKGISFAVTDLLDDMGNPLTESSALLGLQINSTGVDPSLIAAVVPEPSSIGLLALGLSALLLGLRRKH